MRILFVTHNAPRFAGDVAGSFVLRLAVALQRTGAHVHVIAPGAAGVPATDTIDGVSIERVPYARPERMTLAYGGTMAEMVRASWASRFALLGMLRALRAATRSACDRARGDDAPFDVVHAHWWFPAGLALWGTTASLPPLVITMHGSDVRLAQGIAPARAMMRRVLATARVRTAVSAWLAEQAERAAPGVPVRVEPMPVDTERFAPPAMGAARSGVLFVGRLNVQKGLRALLDALASPALDGATLDVVGDGPDADSLRAHATQRGVSARVRWHGALPTSALVAFYQRAQVLAMPSREEGLGLVAVEAQLCETPVVAFDSGGLPDVVQTKSGGTLVPTGDVDRLAEALRGLLEDTPRAREAGRAARTAMLARFSLEHVAARYRAVYAEAAR